MARYTGSAVLGLAYDNGVLLAADTCISLGDRFFVSRDTKRIVALPYSNVLLGFTGDLADFQMLETELNALMLEDKLNGVPPKTAEQILNWITCRHYEQRTQLKPLLNSITVAGIDSNGECLLGVVNHLGVQWKNPYTATSLGAYFANPLMREIGRAHV